VARRARPGRPAWWPRWYELIPEGVLALGLTVFLVDETDAATSAFGSARASWLMAATAAGWLAARVALGRLLRRPVVRAGVFAAAAAFVLAVVVLPAYDDETVVEAFPGAVPAAAPDPTAPGTRPGAPATPTTPSTAAPEPVRLRVGSFRGVDHRAEGTVAIYRAPGGGLVVGLEEFDIQPGPDYDLYVVPGTEREDPDGGTRLDDLRGNRGTQFYEVPAGVDVARGPWSVLVWCETFDVPVATATPA
jgi:hypothetical protein